MLKLAPICLLTCSATFASEALPFWKAKPRVYERIQNREIIVVVDTLSEVSTSPHRAFHSGGGGWVSAPCSFVFKTAQNYTQLTQASDYIKKAEYDAAKNVLNLHVEAFGHKADVGVEPKPSPDQEPRSIAFRIVSGPMTGFSGRVALTDLPKNKCEVGFEGDYKYDEFPIPKLFLEFGMEVIFQRIALRMRGYVEDQYHTNQSPSKTGSEVKK